MRVTVWMWADEQLGSHGAAEALVREWQAEGLTFDQMAFRFEQEMGYPISRETIRRKLKAAA